MAIGIARKAYLDDPDCRDAYAPALCPSQERPDQRPRNVQALKKSIQ